MMAVDSWLAVCEELPGLPEYTASEIVWTGPSTAASSTMRANWSTSAVRSSALLPVKARRAVAGSQRPLGPREHLVIVCQL